MRHAPENRPGAAYDFNFNGISVSVLLTRV